MMWMRRIFVLLGCVNVDNTRAVRLTLHQVLYVAQAVQPPLNIVNPEDHRSFSCRASNDALQQHVTLGRIDESNASKSTPSLLGADRLNQLRERLRVFLTLLVVSKIGADSVDHLLTLKLLATQVSSDQRSDAVAGSRRSSRFAEALPGCDE